MGKKLLLLGGLYYLIPVIESAHKRGIHVITCDYLPNNIAHKYSDEYHNKSILDKDAVLKLAQTLNIDGIMSFAVDPGVETAAYVAEMMNLPFACNYKTAQILQNKDLFRKFLSDHNFNVPEAGTYSDFISLQNDCHRFTFPVIVKPTDSAGSKGVTRVDNINDLESAFLIAKKCSFKGNVIVEDFIEQRGYSSDCDSFSIDGNMILTTFNAQHFDKAAINQYVPSAYSWPSTFSQDEEAYLCAEIQRLSDLLNLRTSIYNIETRIGTNGKPYIMEFSPRGGGNRLAEMVRYIYGYDMIDAAVCGALGLEIPAFSRHDIDGFWAEIVLHSDHTNTGKFVRIDISSKFIQYVKKIDLYIKPGDIIHPFHGANDAIGTIIICCPTKELLNQALSTQASLSTIVIE